MALNHIFVNGQTISIKFPHLLYIPYIVIYYLIRSYVCTLTTTFSSPFLSSSAHVHNLLPSINIHKASLVYSRMKQLAFAYYEQLMKLPLHSSFQPKKIEIKIKHQNKNKNSKEKMSLIRKIFSFTPVLFFKLD